MKNLTGTCTEAQAKCIEYLTRGYSEDNFTDFVAAHYKMGNAWRAGNTRRQMLRKISKQAASDMISELKGAAK